MAQPLQVNSRMMTSTEMLQRHGPTAQSTKVNGEMDMRQAMVPESTPMVICGPDYGRMERETVMVSSLNAKMENHEETSREQEAPDPPLAPALAPALAPDQVAAQLLSPPPPESKGAVAPPPPPEWKAEA